MKCRQCGTDIAEKAIVCYRCGTPTAAPAARPARGRRRLPPWLTWLLTAVAVVAAALVVPGARRHPVGLAAVTVVVATVVAVLVGRLGRRPPRRPT